MENYSYNSSYQDSDDTSPRSREIDFDQPQNAAPWDDQSSAPYKAKFMCSYGGKIQPRPHDNQLSYLGGDTKILAADRSIRFSSFLSKLSAVCGLPDSDPPALTFKYQLPGEDLDALISVTNDDDLEHMMLEYDRLYRTSPKPARMRLFLFPNPSSGSNAHSSYGSDGGKSDRDRFVEALNSGPPVPDAKSPPLPAPAPSPPAANNVDFLFGLEKGIPDVPPHQNLVAPPPPPPPQVIRVPEFPPEFHEDRVPSGSDLAAVHARLQRLQLRDQFEQQQQQQQQQQQARVPGYPAGGKPGDDGIIGEYYLPRGPPAGSMPMSVPPVSAAGYWQEKQVPGYHPQAVAVTQDQQPVYVIPGPAGGVYHAPPVMRQVTGPAGQGYYMQRVSGGVPVPGGPHEVYREQPVYGVPPPAGPQQPQQQPQPQPQLAPHHHPAGPRPVGDAPPAAAAGAGGGGYAQVTAYDSALGRQVYYNAPAPPPGMVVASGGAPTYAGVEGKLPPVSKASPHSQGSV